MQEPTRERRPPINLNDYQQPPQPGPISYVPMPMPQVQKGGSGSINMVDVLLAVILSSVMAAFIVFQLAAPKDAIAPYLAKFATYDTAVAITADLKTKVENLITSTAGFAKKTELPSYPSIPSDLSSQLGKVTSLESKVISLEAAKVSLEDRVKKLESGLPATPGGTTPPPPITSGSWTVNFNPQPQLSWGQPTPITYYYYLRVTNGTTTPAYFRLKGYFTATSGVSAQINTASTSMALTYYYGGTTEVPFTINYLPSATACSALDSTQSGAALYCGAGQYQDVVVKFVITHTTGSVLWNPSFSVLTSQLP